MALMPSVSRLRWITAAAFLVILASVTLLSVDGSRTRVWELSSPFWEHLRGSAAKDPATVTNGTGDHEDHVEGGGDESGSKLQCPTLPAEEYHFRESVHEYARVVVRPQFIPDLKESRLTDMESTPFLSPFLPSPDAGNLPSCNVVPLGVHPNPPSMRKTESNILIGYASQIERLHRFLPTILSTTGPYASAVALVGPESPDTISSAETELQSLGFNVTLHPSDLPYTAEYSSLVNIFAEHTSTHSWFIFLDDDTYLPNTLPLIAERLSHLSPNEPHYIGCPSDSALQTSLHGRWPHGGGGVILSAYTVQQISQHFDECLAEYSPVIDPLGGDHRIFLCAQIAERHLPGYYETGPGVLSNYTVWPEIKQWDLAGPAEGIFEGGLKFWSWHHWVSTGWFDGPEHARQSASVVENAGIKSLLRRWKFNETEFTDAQGRVGREWYVLTNGYSIVRYRVPDISALHEDDPLDMMKVEYTWWDEAKYFIDSHGPTRPKVSSLVSAGLVDVTRWRMKEARKGENGEIRQFYWADYASTHEAVVEEEEHKEEGEDKKEERDDDDDTKATTTTTTTTDNNDDNPNPQHPADIESLIEIIWLRPDPNP